MRCSVCLTWSLLIVEHLLSRLHQNAVVVLSIVHCDRLEAEFLRSLFPLIPIFLTDLSE